MQSQTTSVKIHASLVPSSLVWAESLGMRLQLCNFVSSILPHRFLRLCIVPSVPLHQLFGVFSWILVIYVILLLATIPSIGTVVILRNRISYGYVPK